MIVHINSAAFNVESNFQKLNHMFAFFEDEKHTLFLNEDISESEWVNNASKITKKFCEIEFKNGAYSIEAEVDLRIGNENDLENNIYSVFDGYILLQNNPIIFVENATSDGLFLYSIFNNFTECDKINKNFKNRWIEVRGVGGKNEFKKGINNELRKFRKENLPNEKYLRAIVIVDSDKKYPHESLSNTHNDIINYCNEKKIKYHVLEKREIENYLPIEVFNDFPHNHPIVKSYLNLNSKQQSYYDFQDGFKGRAIKTFDINIQDLFAGISTDDEKYLRVGFDRSIKDFFSKKAFPLLFKHARISRETLLKNCNMQNDPEELIQIIKKLEHLL
ncbi:hypothetical protein [Flavobacterium sp. LHD-85]|uniref:hypothetical protein n=1 Tax=Flavobacterium sp. LHD-85 TaxID=3071410 RepID=UPI0027E16268|nr:hypothetical protein [Flavobacterium sp. LHD-85]MDQ6531063.1 hypothetical protein [Flavobacterium sp. LHD-85]